MTVKVVTVTNKRPEQAYYCYDQFFHSVRRFGHDPVVLGMNEEWKGLMTKPRKLLKWLNSGEADNIDCLIIVDCWDLVFIKSPDEIAEKWAEFGSPVIMGAERNLFPSDTKESSYPHCSSSFRFPNSGFIVGTPFCMKKMLEWMDLDSIPDDYTKEDGTPHHGNDQLEYQLAFIAQPVPIILDTQARFVINLHSVTMNELILDSDGITVCETGSAPMAAHANGGAKTDGVMDKVLEHLKLR